LLTSLLLLAHVFLCKLPIAKTWSTFHFLWSTFIAGVEEVIHYHRVDHSPLVVVEAVAEVTAEAEATGELWIVHFLDVGKY
jgi:hypothetical protein